jgi:hypothetical protein
MGVNGAIHPGTFDVVKAGEKGWEIGGNYTVFKNVVASLRYGKTKALSQNYSGYNKADHFFGRVEFFF